MRRVGIILLVLGLAGFVLASTQRSSYDSVEGTIRATFSKEERAKRDFWENARWMSVGMGVIGLVLVLLPGKKT